MARKLRIVSLLTNLCIGGDPNRLLAFSRELDRSRFEHTVLVIADPSDRSHQERGQMLPQFLAQGIRVESLYEPARAAQRGEGWPGLQNLREIGSFARIVRRLTAYFASHETDIIDARMSYAVLFGALAGRLARVPVIVATEYGPGFWQGPFWRPAGQLAYGLIDALISDSSAKVLEHEAWLWRRALTTAVIPNGIYQPQARCTRSEMRARLGMPRDAKLKVIAQVSRVVPEKGHSVLVQAVARVFAADADCVLLICGYPHPQSYIDELMAQAQALGIRDRVYFVSYPGPVADVWSAIDVHVHASLLDSAPIAIHESLALGLPSVVTRVGGIPDMVLDKVTSLIVEPGDAAALAAALLRVLHEPGLSASMGQAARQHHLAHYQVQRMTRTIEDLFAELYHASAYRHGKHRAPSIGLPHGDAHRCDPMHQADAGIKESPLPLNPTDPLQAGCVVCGASSGKKICQKGIYALMQCDCGAIYLSPPAQEGAVDHAVDSHSASFYDLPTKLKLRWLRQSHASGRLLEVGCGDGHFLRAARDVGFDVCGIELDPLRSERLRQALAVEVECATIEQAQWPPGSCDIVYHCDLLSHFPDPLLALKKMVNLLRPDGILFFEVGILGNIDQRWFDAVPESSIPRHRWFFSEPALRALLAQAGMQIVRMKTFGLGPQVMLSRGLSTTCRSVQSLPFLRAATRADADEAEPRQRVKPDESAMRGRFNNFMRFSVGAQFPLFGPLTAFVIARRGNDTAAP